MPLHKIITAAFFLSIINVNAQDTTALHSQLTESLSPAVALRDFYYESPSMKPLQRDFSKSELYADYDRDKKDIFMQQQGAGYEGFAIRTNSYLKNEKNNSTLWGRAFYNNYKLLKVNYNESLDYALIYPYVMADTVGGDMTSETYYFAGGASRKIKSIQYGIEAGYQGAQGYREVDPRPKNTTSALHLVLSAAANLGSNHALSVDLGGRKYTQTSNLEFANELGSPLVYHEAGLGVYNSLLAGNRSVAKYSADAFSLAVNLAPTNRNGIAARFSFEQLGLDKRLSGIRAPIGHIEERLLDFSAAYLVSNNRQNLALSINAQSKKRDGIESKFANQTAELSLLKISEDLRYRDNMSRIAIEGAYERNYGRWAWHVGFEAAYHEKDEQYLDPNRSQRVSSIWSQLNTSYRRTFNRTLMTVNLSIGRSALLDSGYQWAGLNAGTAMEKLLTSNYNYLTTAGSNLEGGIRIDQLINQKINYFFKAQNGYHEALKRNYFNITTGIVF